MTTSAQLSDVSAAKPPRRFFSLWGLSVVFVLVAMFTSGYLSYTKLTNTSVICMESGAFDCDAVTSSRWSKFMGIDVAYLGFISYSTLFVLLMLEKRVAFFKKNGLYIIFGLILFDFMFHCYLTYNSLFVLQKACIWCLTTHLMALLILITTGIRVWKRLGTGQAPVTQNA